MRVRCAWTRDIDSKTRWQICKSIHASPLGRFLDIKHDARDDGGNTWQLRY